jgi:hypothetical protein
MSSDRVGAIVAADMRMGSDDFRAVFIMDKRAKFPDWPVADLYRAAVAAHPLDDDQRPSRAFEKAARRESRDYAKSVGRGDKLGYMPGPDLTLMRLGRLAKEHGEAYYVAKCHEALTRDRNVITDRPERPRDSAGEPLSDEEAAAPGSAALRTYLEGQSLARVVQCGNWQVPEAWLDDVRYFAPLADPDDMRSWISGSLDGDPYSVGQVLYAFEVCNHRYDF